MFLIRSAASAFLVFLTAAAAVAQTPAPARIDSIFAQYDRDRSPGCLLGVVRNGALVYQRGYGYANLDYGIRHSPEMVYYVGSVSKQFTAAVIALLAQEGRISLGDDVRRYIPELPDYGRTITISHLVHHTAGLRDIYTLMSLAGIRMQDVFTDEQALALITAQRELNFAPGDDYLYSNSGYWLLGRIVERVTGRTLRQYADEKLFRPLSMTRTHFHDEPDRIIPNRVISYGGNASSGFRISYILNFDKVGAGGLYTTLGDLVKWDANFYAPTVGGDVFLRTIHTRGELNGGDTLTYAFGNNVQLRRGLPITRHSGSLMGFRADLVRYPTERFSVITLCNLGSIDAARLADRVADLYLHDRLAPLPAQQTAAPSTGPPARAQPQPPTLTAAQAREYAGRYHSPELDVDYAVAADGTSLTLTRRLHGTQPLQPLARDRFSAGGHVLDFVRDAAGRVTGFTVEAGRVRNIRFVRID